MSKANWSRDELIVAFNLYCKTPFTKINSSNKAVKELAPILGRSASAVALKLANFARLDPVLQERNISGMSHGSKEEAAIWNEFNGNWEGLAYQSEQILAKFRNETIENTAGIIKDNCSVEGREREAIIKARVNQNFFRKMILASYDNRCCITGIAIPELLVASHIVPWSVDEKNRINPCNGLCLNALHDKAFDAGLITIMSDYTIRVSENMKRKHSVIDSFFTSYENKRITLPQRFLPSTEFIEYHNKYVFLDRRTNMDGLLPINSDII
jgi:putative restriction endonuclease